MNSEVVQYVKANRSSYCAFIRHAQEKGFAVTKFLPDADRPNFLVVTAPRKMSAELVSFLEKEQGLMNVDEFTDNEDAFRINMGPIKILGNYCRSCQPDVC